VLSLLLQLIDRLIQLVKQRDTQRREKFEHFVEITYRKAEIVATDMLSISRQVSTLCDEFQSYTKDGANMGALSAFKEKYQALAQARDKLLTVRVELLNSMPAIQEQCVFIDANMNTVAAHMFRKVNSMIILTESSQYSTTIVTTMLFDLQYLISGVSTILDLDHDAKDCDVQRLAASAARHLANTESNWREISSDYVKLRAYAYK
jgi:hypothetical protein